jgi:hypothetical protein
MKYRDKRTDQFTFYLSTLKSHNNKHTPIKLKDFTGIDNFGPTCKTVDDPDVIFKFLYTWKELNYNTCKIY